MNFRKYPIFKNDLISQFKNECRNNDNKTTPHQIENGVKVDSLIYKKPEFMFSGSGKEKECKENPSTI